LTHKRAYRLLQKLLVKNWEIGIICKIVEPRFNDLRFNDRFNNISSTADLIFIT